MGLSVLANAGGWAQALQWESGCPTHSYNNINVTIKKVGDQFGIRIGVFEFQKKKVVAGQLPQYQILVIGLNSAAVQLIN